MPLETRLEDIFVPYIRFDLDIGLSLFIYNSFGWDNFFNNRTILSTRNGCNASLQTIIYYKIVDDLYAIYLHFRLL